VPDSREAALRLIEGSNQNLIVVTGHVEDNAFVVRPASGSGFTVPFVDIQRAADATRSQVLLLGCRIACATRFSGAVTDIFQPDVIAALSDLDSTGDVLSLLRHLSEKVGPLLIQEDQGGGFRVIDAAFARGQDSKLTRRGALLVRLMLQVGPSGGVPVLATLSGITLAMFLDRALAVLVIVLLLPWVLVLLLDVGPVRAWRLIKEDRAERLGLKDKLARIRGRALPVYAFFGPWVVITRVAIIFGALFLSIFLLIASPIGGIVAWTVAISATINLRKRWASLGTGEATPGFFQILLLMGLPLLLVASAVGILGAAAAWAMSPNVPVVSELSIEDAWDAFIPIAIGITSVSVLYALTYLSRFYLLLVICRYGIRILRGPGALLVWLERRVLHAVVPHAG
jgi:hypothetical protein